MAIFEGTVQEFHHFIGPRIRNAVNNFTRSYRKQLDGICEDCGSTNELHSAHVHGQGRRAIIEQVLSEYSHDEIIHCNIEEVESKILNAHLPIETCFKFLCHSCHVAYDSKHKKNHIKKNIDSSPYNQNKENEEVKKVKRKIHRWFRNRHQINSRILIAFLNLRNNGMPVSPMILHNKCSDINDFDGNYNQMKNFGEKNHAKVFEENNGFIKLWEPVEKYILEAFEPYKNV